jgi:hypothetical protein
MTDKFRIGVQDPQFGIATIWYDQASKDSAHNSWRLLHDYGRGDITVTMQWLDPDGEWFTVQAMRIR